MKLSPTQLSTIQDIVRRTQDPYWSGYLAAVADLAPHPDPAGNWDSEWTRTPATKETP